MYSRDANIAKTSGINTPMLQYQIKGGGTAAPTIVYGANWISTATHAAGTNAIVVTLKDNINAFISATSDQQDTTAGIGAYATIGNVANAGTTTPLAFTIFTWAAAGSTLIDSAASIGGVVVINNGNITTPGGN